MNENIVGGQNLGSALLTIVRAGLPAVITVGILYVMARLMGVAIDSDYGALLAVVGALATFVLRPGTGAIEQPVLKRGPLVLTVLGRWVAFLGILFTLGYLTKSSSTYSRQLVLQWALITPGFLVALEVAFQEFKLRTTLGGGDSRLAVFAGCNEVSLSLAERITQRPDTRIRIAGFFDDRSLDRLGSPDVSLLGRLPELAQYVKHNGIHTIFVALPMRHIQRVIDLLDDLRDTTASIYYVPDIFVYDLIQARTGEILGIPVVAMCETPFYGNRGVIKRLSDVVVASAALLTLSPLMVLIGLVVKLSSPGPAIFRQKRYGLDGERITVYKFRSMTVTEDGDVVVQAKRDDQRVTRIGRFLRRTSLDELPQLINVVQGRMSLVGPRPHAIAHNEEYRKLIKGYMIRHKVLPGITGLAQVNGCRGETVELEEMQKRVHYDLDYLRRWSLPLDLWILWKTFLLVFSREDRAY